MGARVLGSLPLTASGMSALGNIYLQQTACKSTMQMKPRTQTAPTRRRWVCPVINFSLVPSSALPQ